MPNHPERPDPAASRAALSRKAGDVIRDDRVLEQLNELWDPVYPFLAEYVLRASGFAGARVLELGPFGGGIGLEVLRRVPSSVAWSASDLPTHLHWVDRRAAGLGLGGRSRCTLAAVEAVPARDQSFDLVVARGAFFFLSPGLLREIRWLVRPGGFAWVGGGYGPLTPSGVIEPLALRSRVLNEAIGKVYVSEAELAAVLARSGIESARIARDGGLWIEVRR